VYLADAPYVHTRRWVEHFAVRGVEAHVISFRSAEIPGARVHYIDGFEGIGKARYLVHARRVSALVRELQPDIVHALHLTSYGFLAAVARVRPTVTSVWGTDVLQAPGLTPAHRWITRYALGGASAITATGLRLAEATLEHAPRGTPVSVIPYGVDLDRFRPQPRWQRDEVVIGAVARLSPEKGLDVLLRAVARLAKDGQASRLRIVLAGDGPERSRLERLTSELRLEHRVRFLGEVPHEQVAAVLQSLDVFAMPSTAEGFGVAALEASAMQLPVVASDVHGIPDVVADGETGLLVPPSNVDALAAGLGRLASDASLRRRMGEAGRGFVERHYRWQDNAALMERLYEAQVSGASRN
jgi:glycosyltransferase involved in cell wall biosynthesis